ncbi:hypothetical protein, partial [Bosea rubneri]
MNRHRLAAAAVAAGAADGHGQSDIGIAAQHVRGRRRRSGGAPAAADAHRLDTGRVVAEGRDRCAIVDHGLVAAAALATFATDGEAQRNRRQVGRGYRQGVARGIAAIAAATADAFRLNPDRGTPLGRDERIVVDRDLRAIAAVAAGAADRDRQAGDHPAGRSLGRSADAAAAAHAHRDQAGGRLAGRDYRWCCS